MGLFFSRPRAEPPPSQRTPPTTTAGSPNHRTRASRGGQKSWLQPTSNDVDSYIQELLELSEFFNGLDNLTSGESIPYAVAAEVLDLDDESMNSYLEALSMKANHLSGIRKFLNSHPNIARAGLLRELLDTVEPKCRQMREKMSRLRSSLVVETSGKRHTEAQASNIPDDQPGPSGLCGLTSTGSDQPSPTGSNSVRQSFTSPAARVSQLSEDHCLVVSSSSDGEEESQSEEEMDARPRKPSANVTNVSDWRDENFIAHPKRIKINRSENLLDQVVPWYANVNPKTLRRPSSVIFIGEEGQDFGALSREFFFITFEAVISGMYKSWNFLEGKRGHLIPNAMTDHRAFFFLGRMIVHAVINDCKGLPGLSPAIVHYLVSGKGFTQLEDSHPPLSIDDVADPQLKQLLLKCENGENFNAEEEDAWMNWMTESNCQANWRHSRQLSIQQILLHYVFMKRVRQIQALEEGLKELGLLRFLVKNPTLENISEVFPPDDITAYSPATVEAVIITRGNSFDFVAFDLFKQLMQDLHSGNIANYRLCDLIQYVTSSPYLPERLVVSFDADITIPVAHACYNEITLPVAHQTYPGFREAMVTAFQNGLTGYQLQ